MDGFSLTLYLKQLLLMIAMFDPTVSSTDIANLEIPNVVTVSHKHYVENICKCSCSEDNIYGRFYLDGNEEPTLLVTTPDGGDIPIGVPSIDALMVHELTHYIQYVQGKYKGAMEDGLNFTEEEINEIYQDTELQAYQNQNKFLKHHGIPTMNIAKGVAWSTTDSDSCGEETKMAGR